MPMQIGLDSWRPEDADYFDDLGVNWTKINVPDADKGVSETFGAMAEAASAKGLNVIADLRPSGELEQRIGLMREQSDPNGIKFDLAMREMTAGIAANVRAFGPLVAAWELWGEYNCPHVGGFFPGGRVNYPNILSWVYSTVKEVAPEAQVWNGGYGVEFQPQFAEALIDDAPLSFDALNWHHYNISRYSEHRDANGAPLFDEPLADRLRYSAGQFTHMFQSVRERMDARGCRQPFVASEWGMPVVSDEVVEQLKAAQLFSFVFQDGAYGLGETEAAAYMDVWLSTFERIGMEVLVIHRLRDDVPHGADMNGTFWGVYCGLLFADGKPKLTYDLVKSWAHHNNGQGAPDGFGDL
jgi:hypothetical protein